MTRDRALVRAYAALVSLYPRRFRVEFGPDMVELVRLQCRDESTWRVAGRVLLDIAITVPTTHLEARMNRTTKPAVPLVYMAIAAGGALLAFLGGTSVVAVIIGLTVALGAGTVGVVAWRRTAPQPVASSSGTWWKFILAGPVLIAMVIGAARAGVDAWYLGMLTIATACGLIATGLVLGVLHVVGRRSRPIST